MGQVDPLPPQPPGEPLRPVGGTGKREGPTRRRGARSDEIVLSNEGRRRALEDSGQDAPIRSQKWLRRVELQAARVKLLAGNPPGVQDRLAAAQISRKEIEADQEAQEEQNSDVREARRMATIRYREIGRQDPRNLGF